jgi:hypothetical protein
MEKLTTANCSFENWAQEGMVRMILDHCDNNYMDFRETNIVKRYTTEVRQKIKEWIGP